MKIDSRHYILVIFALCAFVFSAIGYFFMYRTIVSQAQSSSKVITEINAENGRKQQESDLTKIYYDTITDRTRISSFFIHEDKVVDFIQKMEKIGTDSGTELDLSSISSDGGYVKAHVSDRGSWSNLMRALVLIENLPYSLTISNVRLDSSGDHKWNLTLNIEEPTIK